MWEMWGSFSITDMRDGVTESGEDTLVNKTTSGSDYIVNHIR